MDAIYTLLESVSYLGVVKKLMTMSSTDIAVLFLVSKPAFILTAGLAVLTARRGEKRRQLAGGGGPARLLEADLEVG